MLDENVFQGARLKQGTTGGLQNLSYLYDEAGNVVRILYASFSYDGDGVRVKGTVNGTATAYVDKYDAWPGARASRLKC